MQSNIPFSSQYDNCIHDLYRAFQAFKMQSIKIFPRYIYTSDALLFGTSADANRFSPWDMILSDRICASFAKIKKADYLCKTEKSAEEASASFYFAVFNISVLTRPHLIYSLFDICQSKTWQISTFEHFS